MRVAIKTLKPSATAKTRQDFFREADLMVELKHPNIVGLLGVCTKDEPRCMLFEYMTQVSPDNDDSRKYSMYFLICIISLNPKCRVIYTSS